MSYDFFSESPVGTVKYLHVEFGQILFCKSSTTMWLVEVSLNNVEPFIYTRFTQTLTCIEASCLFDKYEKEAC